MFPIAASPVPAEAPPGRWKRLSRGALSAMLAALPAALPHNLPAASTNPARPNILLFVADDMGWQDTSVPFWHGGDGAARRTFLNARYHTPNMERLAAGGMLFTHAYASPICSPTRCSLMSGMNAARHRVTNWTLLRDQPTDAGDPRLTPPDWSVNGMQPEGTRPSGESRRTLTNEPYGYAMKRPYTTCTPLPELLRRQGYTTIHCGKAHWGAKDTPGANPLLFGFDYNIAGSEIGGPADYRGSKRYGEGRFHVRGLDENGYYENDIFLTEALTREALKLLTRLSREPEQEQKPFFLYMSHYAVHAPFDERGNDKRFVGRYPDGALRKHPEDGFPWSANERRYAALIEGMDKSLGDLMAWLDENGLAESTVILFFSDNGGLALSGRMGDELSNYPLRCGKGSCHEGGIRVPMLAFWPGVTRAGSVCPTPVIAEDFFPTLLELAGCRRTPATRQTMDGVSFVSLLRGETPPRSRTRSLLFHVPNLWGEGAGKGEGYGPQTALVKGDWKLIYHHIGGRMELYNLAEDIGERSDLSAGKPEILKTLAREAAALLRARHGQMPREQGVPAPLPDEAAAARPGGTGAGGE